MRQARRNRRRRGFTLLEILIVVGIIALLAAFVVPDLIKTSSKASEDITRVAIGASGPVAGALDLYRIHMGTYPEELKDLTEKPDDDEDEKWQGPYISNPQDLKDAWKHDLQYRFPGEVNEQRFDLWSNGADGDEGTDDDIKNWSDG